MRVYAHWYLYYSALLTYVRMHMHIYIGLTDHKVLHPSMYQLHT